MLVAAGSSAAGAAVAGFSGALIGLTLSGGIRNAARAGQLWHSEDPKQRTEASRSGMMGLIEIGLAGYFVYRVVRTSDE